MTIPSSPGRIVASIEARFGSTRLPGKILKPILGKPMLQLLVERVQRARTLDGIVIATSRDPANDPVETLAREIGVACFRGSEDDVLDRVLRAAQSVHTDHIVELWGDNPLIDPAIIDEAVREYRATGADCVGTCLDKTYPVGQSLLVFSARVLAEVAARTADPVDRENVSNYIYEHPDRYTTRNLPCPDALRRPDVRMTVDEPADFDVVRSIFEHFASQYRQCSAAEILAFLDAHPDIRLQNATVRQRTLAVQRGDG